MRLVNLLKSQSFFLFLSLLVTLILGPQILTVAWSQDQTQFLEPSPKPTSASPGQNPPIATENLQSLEKTEKSMKAEKKKQDKNTTRFTALVKILRDGQDEMQVFFEGHPNYYILNTQNSTKAGKYSQILVDSMKRKIPVHVETDTKSRRIKKVSNSEEDDE